MADSSAPAGLTARVVVGALALVLLGFVITLVQRRDEPTTPASSTRQVAQGDVHGQPIRVVGSVTYSANDRAVICQSAEETLPLSCTDRPVTCSYVLSDEVFACSDGPLPVSGLDEASVARLAARPTSRSTLVGCLQDGVFHVLSEDQRRSVEPADCAAL